jgi:hypothetical protein
MNLRVIYLPTEQVSGILNTSNGLTLVDVLNLSSTTEPINIELANFEDIFIVDLDAEIGKFDWYIDRSKSNIVGLVNALQRGYAISPLIYSDCYKVIASTNLYDMPQISQEFVKEWISNPIGTVTIENDEYVWNPQSSKGIKMYNESSIAHRELINYYCTGFSRECPTIDELAEFYS